MCRRITCKRCHRPSWAGCGAHVEQVLRYVPNDQRCSCDRSGSSAEESPAFDKITRPNWLQRLRNR